MTLQKRLAVAGLVAALPIAYGVTWIVSSIRQGEMATALERVVKGQLNDQVRERCESDPQWFLMGPLEGRPKAGEPKPTDPDVFLPRPKVEERPFELFAYDETFTGSSTAAARFPQEIKNALRSGSRSQIAPFDTPEGQGAQIGILTSWSNGPCAVFLARMRPVPGQTTSQVELFLGVVLAIMGAVVLVITPTARRIRQLSEAARQAGTSEYTVTVPATGHDELTAIGASFNEASADIRRRIADVKDREESHRRFVARVTDELGPAMKALEGRLGGLDRSTGLSGPDRAALRGAIGETHHLLSDLANLLAAARLRMRIGLTEPEALDVGEFVARAVKTNDVLARASDVKVDLVLPKRPLSIVGDSRLCELAMANVIENAIRYNRPGGHVRVALRADEPGRFAVEVEDNGPGVSEAELAQLNAVKRFRGDEGQGGPGARGLGLAIVWEVAERCQWQVAIRRAQPVGLFVSIMGRAE